MDRRTRIQIQTNRSTPQPYPVAGFERGKVAPGFGSALPSLVVFTDLDGTLLEGTTYQYDTARPALDRLRERSISLIFCTSKTRAEVEPLREELDNRHPFIVENGGAIYIPVGYFQYDPPGSIRRNGYRLIELGVPRVRLREALRTIEKQVGTTLVGLGDMTLESLMRVTGLGLAEADRARQREYDEPFLIEDSHRLLQNIRQAARRLGLAVIPGGRFFHLVGGTDKGRACRVLLDLYRKECGTVFTAGIGDSLNDLPMLDIVDRPFLVERPGGGHAEGIAIEGLTRLHGIGPAGWVNAVNTLLRSNSFQTGLFIFHPLPFTY